MGIEGDGDGGDAELARAGDYLRNDPLVAAMHAVEVADGGDGWAKILRDLCELMVDLHDARFCDVWKFILSPNNPLL